MSIFYSTGLVDIYNSRTIAVSKGTNVIWNLQSQSPSQRHRWLAVLVGIKHSNQGQQRSINVEVGVGAEYEHLEIRMQTADRWYIW